MDQPQQLDLGALWRDVSGIIQCSCAAHGPVLIHDRPIAHGLIERTSRCEACGERVIARLSAPKPRRLEAPLLDTMENR